MQKYKVFTNQPWAIMPERLLTMMELDASGIEVSTGTMSSKLNSVSIAHLPLWGVTDQHSSFLLELFGGTSTDAFGLAFDLAMADDSIGAILIDVDSPGGSVYGTQELSDKIYNARGKKPIIAVANSLMASAAYFIASAADEILITPSGEAGSIGVVAVHLDHSKFLDDQGVKPTIITAGKHKAEGNPYEPLNDEAFDYLQKRVNEYYTSFVSTVARNRGISAATVLKDFGQGRVLGAREAKDVGMVDDIATVETVYKSLSQTKTTLRRASAAGRKNKAKLEIAKLR